MRCTALVVIGLVMIVQVVEMEAAAVQTDATGASDKVESRSESVVSTFYLKRS